MNILIKLTCLIGLVIAPILGQHSDAKPHGEEIKKEINIAITEKNKDLSMKTSMSAEPVNDAMVPKIKQKEKTITKIAEKAQTESTLEK
jgi:K(+)-stimulated pyrophosphate-energized sodium pump